MKLSPKLVRAGVVLVVGVLVLGFTAWKVAPGKKRTLVDLAQAKFMHCVECQTEVRFDADGLEKACLECGSDKGFVATTASLKEGGGDGASGRMVSFLLPEIVLLLGALWFVLRPRDGDREELYRYMRCANCGQKLRYRAAQVGAMGACSRCKRAFLFPEGTQRETDLDGGVASGQLEEVED